MRSLRSLVRVATLPRGVLVGWCAVGRYPPSLGWSWGPCGMACGSVWRVTWRDRARVGVPPCPPYPPQPSPYIITLKWPRRGHFTPKLGQNRPKMAKNHRKMPVFGPKLVKSSYFGPKLTKIVLFCLKIVLNRLILPKIPRKMSYICKILPKIGRKCRLHPHPPAPQNTTDV